MSYFVQRITRVAELKRLESEWDEIDRLSSPRVPFSSPMWNLLWWRHFRESHPWIRDELFVLAVRDEQKRLVALAPLMRTSRPAWGPLREREIQLFGADDNVTELRGLICRPGHRGEAMRALDAHLRGQAGEWDSMYWGGVPAGEPVEGMELPPPSRTTENYYLRLPGTWQELTAGLSRNMKEALRKCYNSLKREGHEFTFRMVGAPDEVDPALFDFFRLHRERAQMGGTVQHSDTFRTGRSRRFLRDYARRMAQRNLLRIFRLEIGGEVVATRIGFVLGDELYLYYSGYSPQWRKYSVMTALVAESIKWAVENRFRIVNLSTGRDYAKMRWRPIEVAYAEHSVISPLVENRYVYSRLMALLRHKPVRAVLRRLIGVARRGR